MNIFVGRELDLNKYKVVTKEAVIEKVVVTNSKTGTILREYEETIEEEQFHYFFENVQYKSFNDFIRSYWNDPYSCVKLTNGNVACGIFLNSKEVKDFKIDLDKAIDIVNKLENFDHEIKIYTGSNNGYYS